MYSETNSYGCSITIDTLTVQPIASVITAVYVPAAKPELLKLVLPLLQRIVKGAVPPEAVTLAEPLASP